MKKEETVIEHHHEKHGCHCHSGGSCGLYGVGVVGALFYFLQNAHGFVPIVTGIAKAFFWPAFIVFRVLTDLHI